MRNLVLALSLSVALSSAAFAQDPASGGDKKKRDMLFSVQAGRFLPYGIYGVRDIYPYWSMRYGHPFGSFNIEWTTGTIKAKGVTMYFGSISWTFPTDLEGFTLIPFLGLDAYYYRGHTNLRELDFHQTFGTHLGFSPLIPLGDLVALRADFKFNFGPGKSMFVGSGIQFSF